MSNNIKAIPADGLAGLKQNWQADLTSGFIVFLIALPLCLGIALASGVPPMAGIIAAVIGGLVVSQISGSYVTINGPAAGLIVVILGAVESLGGGDAMLGYRTMLAAVVVSGVLLFIFGQMKAGKLGAFFPASAVHGMLAAIGVIIMSKQLHVMLGVRPEAKEPLGLLAEVPTSLGKLNPEIAIIGAVSLLVMAVLPLIRNKYVQMLPGPMLVVLIGIGFDHLFDLEHEHKYLFLDNHEYTIGPRFLVTLPERVLDGIILPDFDHMLSGAFLMAVISVTLVQGVETLLSASAVDRLDPYKRKSDMNKDLRAIGAGSALSGLLGGLPMIAEIVRSSANINNGARTRWANFFHGAFMLIFVVFFPQLIHQIPLASLAAILVFTGYRLASPKQFQSTLRIGIEQLAIFTTTLLITLATDLIVGVASGIALKFVIHLVRGASFKTLFRPDIEVQQVDAQSFTVTIRESAIFSNYIRIKRELESIPHGNTIVIDFSQAKLVDHTVMENLHHFAEDYAHKGGSVQFIEMQHMQSVSAHPMAARKA